MTRSVYQNTIKLETGQIAPNSQVNIYEPGTAIEVPVYAAPAGGSPLPQPIISDERGEVIFYLEPDIVDIYVFEPVSTGQALHVNVEIGAARDKLLDSNVTEDIYSLENVGFTPEDAGDILRSVEDFDDSDLAKVSEPNTFEAQNTFDTFPVIAPTAPTLDTHLINKSFADSAYAPFDSVPETVFTAGNGLSGGGDLNDPVIDYTMTGLFDGFTLYHTGNDGNLAKRNESNSFTGEINIFENPVQFDDLATTERLLPDANNVRDIGALGTQYRDVYSLRFVEDGVNLEDKYIPGALSVIAAEGIRITGDLFTSISFATDIATNLGLGYEGVGDDRQLRLDLSNLSVRSNALIEDLTIFKASDTDTPFAISLGDLLGGYIGPLKIRGAWDADGNIVTGDPLNTSLIKGVAPAAPGGVEPEGFLYIVNKAGVFDLTDDPGPESWEQNDKAIWTGNAWIRVPRPPNEVFSVFGRKGDVLAEFNDYSGSLISLSQTGGVTQTNVQAELQQIHNDYTPTSRRIDSGDGLQGGGDLTQNRELSLTGQFKGVELFRDETGGRTAASAATVVDRADDGNIGKPTTGAVGDANNLISNSFAWTLSSGENKPPPSTSFCYFVSGTNSANSNATLAISPTTQPRVYFRGQSAGSFSGWREVWHDAGGGRTAESAATVVDNADLGNIGKSGADFAYAADCNEEIKTGFYKTNSSTENTPDDGNGFGTLIISGAGNTNVQQIWQSNFGPGIIYQRRLDGGTWREWNKIWMEGNLSDPATLSSEQTFTETQEIDVTSQAKPGLIITASSAWGDLAMYDGDFFSINHINRARTSSTERFRIDGTGNGRVFGDVTAFDTGLSGTQDGEPIETEFEQNYPRIVEKVDDRPGLFDIHEKTLELIDKQAEIIADLTARIEALERCK